MSTFFRYDGTVNATNGFALSGVIVYVCTQPAVTTTNPPSPLATIYSDNAGANPINQSTTPLTTDGNGNFFFYAATGTYTVVYFDPLNRITPNPQVFADQEVVSPGGGSVTSIAMTGDGVIFASTISGSPISSSGTLNLLTSLLAQNANTFLRGPTSGGAATPTFGKIVTADLPAGAGTVTSVALALNGSALLSFAVSGSPITGSGTITGTINFVNFSANTFLAGPTSGAAAPPTARQAVAADIFGVVPIAFASSMTFNAALFPSPTFTTTLTGNVTSSSVTNPTAGQRITFIITQDGTGSRSFAFPSNFKGNSLILADEANSVFVQSFVYDGVNWRADGPGSVNES